jgi:two-component system nitrogen regulation response regulator GlnG/two-component system response regulator HydG
MAFPFLETTAPAAAQTTDARRQVPMLALLIVQCEKEPWRVGQYALFPLGKKRWMGRGGEPIEDYSSFDEHRPGEPPPVPLGLSACLHGASLSRCQAGAKASAVDIAIENVGRCVMLVNGEEATKATVRPGDTITFVGEVVLLCVLRLPVFPALMHARVAHPFGEPDANGIVGEGPEAWRVRDEATRLGRGTDFVLILGETGTGKTAVAELIHKESSRAHGPFVPRNSVVFTTTILESQLFGKIANFPNPGPAVDGVLPAADGGTLFLDEIGRLSPEAQGHLLCTLENGSYHRLGESKARKLDVRFLGASNLERSALQSDFHFRFKAEIRIAPLRERREDIPLLAREMLRRRLAKDPTLARFFMKDHEGRLHPRMSGRLVDFLVRSELPGNTRELDSLLAAAIAHSPEDRIAMFPGAGASPSVRPLSSAPVSSAPPSDPPPTTKDAQVEERMFTTEVVLSAIASANGNLTLAAKILDTERTKLYRIMKKLGIKREEE